MIISTGRIALDYILASPRMSKDYRHWRGFPLGVTTKQQPEIVAQKLIDAGLATIHTRNIHTGEPMSVHMEKLTIEQVEEVCLTPADIKRIDKWLARGIR